MSKTLQSTNDIILEIGDGYVSWQSLNLSDATIWHFVDNGLRDFYLLPIKSWLAEMNIVNYSIYSHGIVFNNLRDTILFKTRWQGNV